MVQYKPSAQEILDRKSYGQGSRARFDPQWAMSRPTDWYQNRDNLSLVKDTLVRQPAVTTDQNESRNMYQMLMNQIRGGGGAQLLDTSGIPAGAKRIGRTLFTDPAKSQGFFRDVGSLFTGKNQSAVRAPVHNVFGNFGQKGKDFYKKEFPIQSGLNTLMDKAGSMMPYASWLSKLLPKRKKEIIPRNPMFSPENNPWGLPWELLKKEDLAYEPETIWGPEGDPNIGMAGMEEYLPDLVGWNEEWGSDDLTSLDPNFATTHQEPEFIEDTEETIEQTFDPELDGDQVVEDTFNSQYSFVEENPDLTPYEWIMTMVDETGSTMDEVIQNGIFNGILIEN